MDRVQRIAKRPGAVTPNLVDYGRTRREFRWEDVREELTGLPEHGLNIAHAAVHRHVAAGRGHCNAIRWMGKHGERRVLCYRDLAEEVDRFASLLSQLGVQPGETVFSLSGRVPELYVAALGALAHRAVFCPLFSAFGPEPILTRMAKGEAKVLVTTKRLYDKKVAAIRERVPSLEHVLVVGDDAPAGTLAWNRVMRDAEPHYETGPTRPETPALLHFTSGTTGQPKGALHVHGAVLAHHATGRFVLDLHEDENYWCTADPGWVTGTSYGIIAPLTHGATLVVDEAEFEARRWYETLARERIAVWYTAPTAIRMLMKAGPELAREHEYPHLRLIASVGEALDPEGVAWGVATFGLPIHDTWWQTETGGIMIANYASVDIKPGSMGLPLPGIDAAIVERTSDGVKVIEEPGVQGEIAIRAGWPSMFRSYIGQPQRYEQCFADGWYLSGDLARRDTDGYFWFVGRADDVIKSAGHLIGPFEVESALVEHPAVLEAAVIGKPDPIAGQVVKAFVTLTPGTEADDAVHRALMAFARKRLGSAVAPREIDIVDDLPKTRSGKIMRRLLLARDLGLPEGDTSTLERPS